jgi:serine/threonine protein kinase
LSRGTSNSAAATVDQADQHEDYYKSAGGVFPVRWTAPESMETLRFSPASDVWSFGIVVIELMVNGETPYHGMSNPDVMKMTMSGGRHAKPPLCTAAIYSILLKCWAVDPAERPTFGALAATLKQLIAENGGSKKSKSADGNRAAVEAATQDRIDRGEEAENSYTAFGGAPAAAGAVGGEVEFAAF